MFWPLPSPHCAQVFPGGSTSGWSLSAELGSCAGTKWPYRSSQSSPPSGQRTTPPSCSPQGYLWCSACWRPARYHSRPSVRPLVPLTLRPDRLFIDRTPEFFWQDSLTCSCGFSLQDYVITKRLASVSSHCYGCCPVPPVPPMDATLSTQLGNTLLTSTSGFYFSSSNSNT